MKAGHSSNIPVTQKDWVSRLQITSKEQVSKTQVTQIGLGCRVQEREVTGKKAISKVSAQVGGQPQG